MRHGSNLSSSIVAVRFGFKSAIQTPTKTHDEGRRSSWLPPEFQNGGQPEHGGGVGIAGGS
jgi:hypothetical protein